MQSGDFDRRITLQSPVITRDTDGGTLCSWINVATVWAQARALTARQRFVAQQEREAKTTVFKMRFRSDVQPDWRISYDGNTYRIVGKIEIGRRMYLEIEGEMLQERGLGG